MSKAISIRGARVHNLKNISLDIPKEKLVVITGLSGSGKSSLAFDTIYAEGQRRYVESLSSYARQFLDLHDRPDVDEIHGLSPTIAIDQHAVSENPRSTVGTATEVYDYLRLMFARLGHPHCPRCKQPVTKQNLESILREISMHNKEGEVVILSPVVREAKGEFHHLLENLNEQRFREVRVDGCIQPTSEAAATRLAKEKKHTIEIVVARVPKDSTAEGLRPVLKQALELGNGMISLVVPSKRHEFPLSLSLVCAQCSIPIGDLEPRLFSFNSPVGACPECTGLGETLVVDPDLVIPNPRLTIAQGAIRPWVRIAGNNPKEFKMLEAVGKSYGFSLDTPITDFGKKAHEALMNGTGDETYETNGTPQVFPGLTAMLQMKYRETDSDYVRKEIEGVMRTMVCPSCAGKRLKPEALAVTVLDKSIAEIVTLSIEDALEFFQKMQHSGKNEVRVGAGLQPAYGLAASRATRPQLPMTDPAFSAEEHLIAKNILREMVARLQNLDRVGLSYLTLGRSAPTLSGGEAQRVRLATQLGSDLTGVIYILDEPSIGLHPRDTSKLIDSLRDLRDLGNTVIVVEHDASLIKAAEFVVDVGPGAGSYGGEIVAKGTAADLGKNPNSITGQYLAGKRTIDPPKKYRKGNGKAITVKGATANNLKNIDVRIPLGTFVVVTGVSGSGKSTLALDILARALSRKFYGAKELPAAHAEIKGVDKNIDKVISVDQSPIGRTPRSNPATYTGVFTAIRDLFTEIPEAKLKGYDAGKFSFNVKGGGRCEACTGEGYVQIAMHFLPDVYVECKECHGKRYNAEALEIHYRGKNIADVLDMTVEDARQFFAHEPNIGDKLGLLHEVGLGYMKLGQPATTLSGGEAQRVKLATELSRRATGKTLYILDEPTTGLHFEDAKHLLGVLQRLVDKGNTVLVIEHNLDVIKSADCVIDLGPEGGVKGGELVAIGTPPEVARVKKSLTGQYLKKVL